MIADRNRIRAAFTTYLPLVAEACGDGSTIHTIVERAAETGEARHEAAFWKLLDAQPRARRARLAARMKARNNEIIAAGRERIRLQEEAKRLFDLVQAGDEDARYALSVAREDLADFERLRADDLAPLDMVILAETGEPPVRL